MFALLNSIFITIVGYYLTTRKFMNSNIDQSIVKEHFSKQEYYKKTFAKPYIFIILYNLIAMLVFGFIFGYILWLLWLITANNESINSQAKLVYLMLPGFFYGLSYAILSSFSILRVILKDTYRMFIIYYNQLYGFEALSQVKKLIRLTLLIGLLTSTLIIYDII